MNDMSLIINGVDLTALTEDKLKPEVFPDVVPGRTLHVDADFLAYQTSYVREDDPKTLEDMKHNCELIVEKFRRQAGAQHVHLHLTPGTSDKGGRHKQAIQKEYQANRKEKPKPAMLHIMRQWMPTRWQGTLYQHCEADDGMSSAQYYARSLGSSHLSVILSKDKDLRMVPGWHMDWDTGEVMETKGEFGEIWLDTSKTATKCAGLGQKFFWAQMLMGDSADNIQGLPFVCGPTLSKPAKCGAVTAHAMLSGITSNKDAFAYVRQQYELTGKKLGFTHWQTGENVPWQHVMVSEMQLLWMRRDNQDKDDVLKWLGTLH